MVATVLIPSAKILIEEIEVQISNENQTKTATATEIPIACGAFPRGVAVNLSIEKASNGEGDVSMLTFEIPSSTINANQVSKFVSNGVVTIEAGYVDSVGPSPRTVFSGRLQSVKERYERGRKTWIFSITESPNNYFTKNVFVNAPTGAPETAATLIKSAFAQAGLPAPIFKPSATFQVKLSDYAFDGVIADFIPSILTAIRSAYAGGENVSPVNPLAHQYGLDEVIFTTVETGVESVAFTYDPNSRGVITANPTYSQAAATPVYGEDGEDESIGVATAIVGYEMVIPFDPRLDIGSVVKIGDTVFTIDSVKHSIGTGSAWTTQVSGKLLE